jgi:hypothetical protein
MKMDNSLKIGAVSGLIAGSFTGITHIISINFGISLGFFDAWFHPIFPKVIEIIFVMNIIWGIILGIIYSKAHRVIPGKGISKGLIYGLTLYLIVTIRTYLYGLTYGYFWGAISNIIFISFGWIAYGLVIGILYEFLRSRYYLPEKKPEVIEYAMKSGIIPGAIAGLIGGVASIFFTIISPAIGIFDIPGAPTEATLDFLIGLAGSELFVNMFWGAVFGAIFAKVYNLVPSKGILKGLIYGLVVFLITSFQNGTLFISMGIDSSTLTLVHLGLWNILVGVFVFITYGLVLGLLYRKPSD